jgi:hypothetical protein
MTVSMQGSTIDIYYFDDYILINIDTKEAGGAKYYYQHIDYFLSKKGQEIQFRTNDQSPYKHTAVSDLLRDKSFSICKPYRKQSSELVAFLNEQVKKHGGGE